MSQPVHTPPAFTVLNTMYAGAVRLPGLALEVTATYHLAILSLKVIQATFKWFFGGDTGDVSKSGFVTFLKTYSPQVAIDQSERAEKLTWKELGKTIATCALVGAISTEISRLIVGDANPIINKVLGWTGHVQYSEDGWKVAVITKEYLKSAGWIGA